ncbi:MAG: substrate-binding domain-containing protein, partial [Oscillospiraceae bacterium]|nr:substrate-binding domain-containing protein [Oscillospiraceae bacterium]
IPLNKRLCILEPDNSPYVNPAWLMERVDAMPSLPDAFICANDFLAVPLMQVLRQKNLKIPDDIMIAGFDGSIQSVIVDPPLTTVKIPSREMGYYAAGMLLERIESPDLPFRFTTVQTTPVWTRSIREPARND